MAVNIQELLPAVLEGKDYLKDFDYPNFEKNFGEFKENYSELLAAAVAETAPEQLAEEFMAGLENAWPKKRFARKEAVIETRMLITIYLTPLLLQLGDNGAAFAMALSQKWTAMGKGGRYEICSYEKIKKSFRKRMFGFDLGPAAEE